MNFSIGAAPKKKYGLVKPGKKVLGFLNASAPPASRPTPSLFAGGADEEEVDQGMSNHELVNRALQQSALKSSQKQFEEAQKALAEDPTVYDYDGVYDDIQRARQSEREQRDAEKAQPKKTSKYINTLMEKATIRQREIDRARERKLLKERQAEDDLYGQKDKYVTAAYKKKLEEDRRWEAADAKEAAREEAESAARRGTMSGFYSNLLTRNIAMGSNVKDSAKSLYTVGNRAGEGTTSLDKAKEKLANEGEAKQGDRREREGSGRPVSPSGEAQDVEKKRKVDELAEKKAERHEEEKAAMPPPTAEAAEEDAKRRQAEAEALARKEREDKIAAAKARFLARKK